VIDIMSDQSNQIVLPTNKPSITVIIETIFSLGYEPTLEELIDTYGMEGFGIQDIEEGYTIAKKFKDTCPNISDTEQWDLMDIDPQACVVLGDPYLDLEDETIIDEETCGISVYRRPPEKILEDIVGCVETSKGINLLQRMNEQDLARLKSERKKLEKLAPHYSGLRDPSLNIRRS